MALTRPFSSQIVAAFTGLFKGTAGGVTTQATAGTDYVEPATRTDFTAPQRPSITAETAPAAGTVVWTLTSSQILRVNLNANITTLTLSGLAAAQNGLQFQMVVRFNGGTAITWGSNVVWPAGVAPTLTGTSGKLDIFAFTVSSADGGTTWNLFNTGYVQNL